MIYVLYQTLTSNELTNNYPHQDMRKIMTQSTLEILDSLLSGHKMTSEELDVLLNDQIPEDLYLEYKRGDILDDKKKGANTLRQYISGFANSAGGVLFVGIDEQNWEITGCIAPGRGDLSKWGVRCLNEIASYFSPPPRFRVITHPKGKVLVVTVSRSMVMVPCREQDGFVYYFRFHDQTLKAPEYLISDIMLGRRQVPNLDLTHLEIDYLNIDLDRGVELDGVGSLTFILRFNIENNSLLWAENVRIGTVGWECHINESPRISNHLLSYLNTGKDPLHNIVIDHHLCTFHNSLPEITIEPFTVALVRSRGNSIPIYMDRSYIYPTWNAALYILAQKTTPIWYQISFEVNRELLEHVKKRFIMQQPELIAKAKKYIKLRKLSGERPYVGCDFEDPNPIA